MKINLTDTELATILEALYHEASQAEREGAANRLSLAENAISTIKKQTDKGVYFVCLETDWDDDDVKAICEPFGSYQEALHFYETRKPSKAIREKHPWTIVKEIGPEDYAAIVVNGVDVPVELQTLDSQEIIERLGI